MTHPNRTVEQCLAQFVQAWAEKDLYKLAKCLNDDITYKASIGPNFGQTWHGKDDVLTGIVNIMAYDDADGEVSPPIICGNKAFHTWVYTSKTTGEIIAKGCDIFHFKDGLICLKDAYRKVSLTSDQ